jgi:hypothetical protein
MEMENAQRIAELEAEIATLQSTVNQLEAKIAKDEPYLIHNVLLASEWAEKYADCISNPAIRYLIQKNDIDGILIGRQYFVILTEKTLEYKKSTRGPVHIPKRKLDVMDKAIKNSKIEADRVKKLEQHNIELESGDISWEEGLNYPLKDAV